MRLFIALVFLTSMLIVPQLALATQVTTIDELVAMYNVESCADCHEDIHDEWKESWHSKSLTDSRVLRAWRTFILSGIDKSDQAKRPALKITCLGCHAPQTKVLSDDVITEISNLVVQAVDDPDKAKREEAKKRLSGLNINCIVCHTMMGPGDGKPQAKTIYGPMGSEDTPHKEELGYETVKSEVISKPDFCHQCHTGCDGLPADKCWSTKTAYNEYVSHGGDKSCQQCHMVKVDDVSSHRFPGIYETDFAKGGIDLKMDAWKTTFVKHLENKLMPAIVVKVDLKNLTPHEVPHG